MKFYYPLKIFVVAVKVLDLLTGVSIAFFLFWHGGGCLRGEELIPSSKAKWLVDDNDATPEIKHKC